MKLSTALKSIFLLTLIIVVSSGVYLYFRPISRVDGQVLFQPLKKDDSIQLPWPQYGQAAIGAVGYGTLATHGQQTPVPTASVTKAMTALTILKQKPLKPGEQGPNITMTAADVDIYNNYYTMGGSIAKVANGEVITQYQALQALLLPSANNFADTLAIWAFGSMDKYATYANQLAKSIGMKNTSIADASGFSADTKSTANDLVILGENFLKEPVLAEIVSQQQATVPEAGLIRNVNWLLGTDGVNGIKTGSTEEAGGCYLFSAKRTVEGKSVTVIGAIMAAPSRNTAILDARPLIAASDKGFKKVDVVRAGQNLGSYEMPWGEVVNVKAQKAISLLAWKGSEVQTTATLHPITTPKNKGAEVGVITVLNGKQQASTSVVLDENIASPSWQWRIFAR